MKTKHCTGCNKNRGLTTRNWTTPNQRVCNPCQKETRQRGARNKHLMDTYGISIEEADELGANGCAICGRNPRGGLDIDHDHSLYNQLMSNGGCNHLMAMRMSVRGALCRSHNRRMLPAAKDNPHWLRSAADYLEAPPAFDLIGNPFPRTASGGTT